MPKKLKLLVLCLICQVALVNADLDVVNSEAGHFSNKNVAEIAEIQQLFGSLKVLLEDKLESFGKMPETHQEQHLFTSTILTDLQVWTNQHHSDLLDAKKFLPLPDTTHLRYGRNLVLVVPEKGLYVFLHLLNPHQATPKHWHSQNGLSSLAFATALNEGAYETKWREETPAFQSGEPFIQLQKEYETPLVIGELTAIPGDYGAHIVSNSTDEHILLFEVYFEPEKMSELDVPIAVLGSPIDHFIDTIPVTWLNEHNLMTTAILETWPRLSKAEFLQLSFNQSDFKVFTVKNSETLYVPKAMWPEMIEAANFILQGPENRFLLVLPER
jgi:hypothetical protein